MSSLRSGLSENLGGVHLSDSTNSPMLKRQESKSLMPLSPINKKRKLDSPQIPKTPDTVITTPETPSTVLLDDDGETLPGQEEKIRQHELYNKMRKYKMVPYMLPSYLSEVFVQHPDGSYAPLKLPSKTFKLEVMRKDDFDRGVQAYDYQGKKKESDNLFQGGKKRRTRRRKSHKKKRRGSTRRK